jgi:hypothetical protein
MSIMIAPSSVICRRFGGPQGFPQPLNLGLQLLNALYRNRRLAMDTIPSLTAATFPS